MLNAHGDLSARSPPGLGVYFYSAFNQSKFCGILGVVHEAFSKTRRHLHLLSKKISLDSLRCSFDYTVFK